ncbi:flippase-like domain-containing protein [Halobacteria archaeon AArc-m2/3/4]|uniref:Flippase-like domain-containing protein n=1 Tax=Natronoglomus mannanivorans TaxID=2979990 RepID=A0AAP2YVP0_9EURY|nr:flippase-like domain-containing protein [Halobacteria archaeon AArc-xg1-1]MCU4971514.1 flippase-like domain-containing protein [Halobacteria archaeon AArc-m2/3/4]
MKRRIALGFALAVVLLTLLVSFVGSDDVVENLLSADYRIVALGLASGTLALLFRGLVWVRFLSLVDDTATRGRIGSIFLAAMFVKYATPYGQVATEPFVAYLVSRDSEMAYEDGLAGILSADLLNYVPYYTFGFLAIASIMTAGTVGDDMLTYLTAFGGLFVVVITLSYLVVRQPVLVYRIVLGITALVRRTLGQLSEKAAKALAPDTIRERLDGFYQSVETITSDRKNLAIATIYAHLGMVFLMLPVYIGAVALGYEIAFPVVALVVALGKLGSIVPAPGGLGGVEAVVTAGLTTLAQFDPPAAFTVAIIYRACTYGLTLGLGGICAIGIVFRK